MYIIAGLQFGFHFKKQVVYHIFIAKQGLPFIFPFNNLNVKSFIICIVPSYHFEKLLKGRLVIDLLCKT